MRSTYPRAVFPFTIIKQSSVLETGNYVGRLKQVVPILSLEGGQGWVRFSDFYTRSKGVSFHFLPAEHVPTCAGKYYHQLRGVEYWFLFCKIHPCLPTIQVYLFTFHREIFRTVFHVDGASGRPTYLILDATVSTGNL